MASLQLAPELPPLADDAELPVRTHAARIVAAVRENPVTVIIGETGCGKTTQLAQILLDAGCACGGAVCVTQPRRVAAVSVARRVASERGVRLGEEVGYTVRFEDCSHAATQIKFATDGIMLRELLTDPQLGRYSIIVLDEAHERSLATDILFALLKALAKTRRPALKLCVTSATLDGDKFAAYFGDCPVLRVPGRIFPVTIAHVAEPPASSELMAAAVETVWDIHCRQPPGDILVFMTGSDEIERCVRELNERVAAATEEECGDVQVLPLYGAMAPEMQARVFGAAPPGCRRIVVATNVAETSVTVPGIVYVVDPGLCKMKQFDAATGIEALVLQPISQTAATQRAGRAGRTCPGKCFRLYTADSTRPAETAPEILRVSLVGAVLFIKSLALQDVDVLTFDFLDKPSEAGLVDALRQLYVLDAIDADGSVTPRGKQMAQLPLDPALAACCLAAQASGALADMCALAGCLSAEGGAQHIINNDSETGASVEDMRLGDHIVLLRVFHAWQRAGEQREWCRVRRLNARGLEFARNVQRQLCRMLGRDVGANGSLDELRRSVCAGFATRLAHRLPRHNGYRTVSDAAVLAQIHPSSCITAAGGLGPEWVVYNEMVGGARPMLRQVCAVEEAWVRGAVSRLRGVDVNRLSRRSLPPAPLVAVTAVEAVATKPLMPTAAQSAVEAARQRFLKRKQGPLH